MNMLFLFQPAPKVCNDCISFIVYHIAKQYTNTGVGYHPMVAQICKCRKNLFQVGYYGREIDVVVKVGFGRECDGVSLSSYRWGQNVFNTIFNLGI